MKKEFLIDWVRKVLLSENDVMASYRTRIVPPVGMVTLVLLTIFAVNNLLHERFEVGLIILLAEAVLLADVLAVKRGKTPPVSYGVVMMLLIAAMLDAVVRQGIYGAFWGYPVVLICYFVLPRRMAFLFSMVTLVTLTLFVVHYLDHEMSARVFATLLLTIIMINIVLNVIGELQEAQKLQALTDPLTGAFNRRRMEQALEQVVELGRRRTPNNAMLVIDIDRFKAINDRLGHEAGDRVLSQTVAVIDSRKRKVDLLFRIGGDEFLILLFETNATDAATLADCLRLSVEQAPLLEDQKVTLSIGICAQRAGQSAEDWIKCADTALYRAKHNGRNRIEIVEVEIIGERQ